MKYYVILTVTDEYGVEVEASSPEEAEERARDIYENEGLTEGFSFLACLDQEWNTQEVEE